MGNGRTLVTLEAIAAEVAMRPELRAPSWALGTVHRRSITFATGLCDESTQVVWVQSHGMTGDLRVHPLRPDITSATKLAELTLDDLVALASVEGGTANTSWADGVMSWSGWIGFQTYDKYPEPGVIQRIGDCMIEFAPSGIYVEDWRFQPSKPGVLGGLSLVSETGHDGVVSARRGGLVIAGDHAICSIARREELPVGTRAQDYVRDSADPAGALERVLDCTVDYAIHADGAFRIALSTDPRREGTISDSVTGFERADTGNHLVQKIKDDPAVQSRLWRIDSLTAAASFPLVTAVAADRLAWLQAEADTLVDPVRISQRRAA